MLALEMTLCLNAQMHMRASWFVAGATALVVTATVARAAPTFEIIPFPDLPVTTTSIQNPAYKGSQDYYRRTWDVLTRPSGGLVGHLRITHAEAPLHVRIQAHRALEKDLLPPVEDAETPRWFEPMGLVKETAPLRTLAYQYTEVVEPGDSTVPVVLPGSLQGLYRCRLDVLNGDGDPVFSSIPAELVSVEQGHFYHYREASAWIHTEEEEAEHRINLVQLQSTEKRLTLPETWDAFMEVEGLWIDEGSKIPLPLLRRLILSGHWILGGEGELNKRAEELGLSPHSRVLLGGIVEIGSGGPKDGFGVQNDGNKLYDFHSSRYYAYSDDDDAVFALENGHDLFSWIRRPFLLYTLIVAGVFALCTTVLLPLQFRRLRGKQLVSLWWKTPLIVSGYALLALVVGWYGILPRAPLTDVTEYRLGYGDWPEVFCNVNATAFHYGSKSFGWEAPEAARTTFLPEKAYQRRIQAGTADSPRIEQYLRTLRGERVHQGFGYFLPIRQPFRVSVRGEEVTVHTDRSVRSLHMMLDGNHWADLGSLEAGRSVTLPADFSSRSIMGSPPALRSNWESFHTEKLLVNKGEKDAERCTNCNTYHTSGDVSLETYNDSVILIAVDEEAQPHVITTVEPERQEGRVAWVCQVPVVRTPEPSATETEETP